MEYVYRAQTEWDLGLEDSVFKTAEGAMKALKIAHDSVGMEEDFDECLKDNLYQIKRVELLD